MRLMLPRSDQCQQQLFAMIILASVEIGKIISAEIKYCFEDDDLDKVPHNMADVKVRRLPVLNHDKRA